MITFNNIVERFSLFAENHFFIETFSFGSPDDVDLSKFTSFPLMHLVYTGATYDAGTKTYNLEVYILDVPADKTKKVDRQKEVVSDAEQCAEDIIADIKNGGNIFLFAQDYEVVNATTTPLEEETKNVLSGVLLDLSVAIPYEWDACNAPIDGVEPGGTEVTYARRGVLRMLTLDGTTDVTSVRTINVTNGTLTDDGDGVVTLDTGGVDTLAGLTDVDVTGVTDGQVLKYDDATGEWIPANDQSATSLGNLDDVSITTPADRESLIYDGDNWVNDNLSKADLGLANVDNTSDANKPVSTATQTALDAKADTSSVPTELNDLSDVTITGTPTGNQALIFDGTANVFKSLPNFTNRFEDEAENNKQAITPFAERVYTVKADGDGIFIDAESDTPTAGKVIKRKIYQKTGFLESGAVIGDFTLIHTFADDTAYSATESTFEGFRDGDTYGTPPFTLIQTWEEVTAAPAFTGLLNETYGSGAEAAYSTRRLNGLYSGDCMTIRRASDGTTQSIGFVGEEIDESAIETFCSGTTCTVATWFDQSGNGNNATQTDSTKQPTIYTGGQLVKDGGRLALDFDGSGDGYSLDTSGLDIGSLSSFTVGRFATTANQNMMLALSGNVNNKRWYAPYSTNGNINFGYANSGVAISTTLNTNQNIFTMIAGTTLNGVEAWVNSTSAGTATRTTGIDSTKTGLGNWNGSLYMNGTVQEVIYYASDKSSDRTDIEGNISTYFQSAKLLDESYGSGAEAAYSTRQLRRDQTDCMVIRRASDSTTQTIGFVDGDIDEAAIETFCTGTTCTVYQWLDQSGNGNTATAAAEANEPTIYTGGAIVKDNGRVALDFNKANTQHFEFSTDGFAGDYVDLFLTGLIDNYASNGSMLLGSTTGAATYWQHGNGTNYFVQGAGSGTAIAVNNSTRYLFNQFSTATTINSHLSGSIFSDAFAVSAIPSGSRNYLLGKYPSGNNWNYDGKMQEFIAYPSQRTSGNRTSIEENIGDYFTQNTPLLDTYSGAAAAYSLRKLRTAYTGDAVEVYNGSSYADIGFNVFGELDTVALAAHCGSNDGFVSKWYDQAGSNDATQTATASMPKIYDGTTGVITENGKPAVDFVDGTYKALKTAQNFTNSDTLTVYGVVEMQSAAWQAIAGLSTASNVRNELKVSNSRQYNIIGTGSQLNGPLIALSQQTLTYGQLTSSGGELAINGNTATTGTGTTVQGVTNSAFAIGSRAHTSGESWTGTISEVIMYFGTPPNRTNIEDNINTFYNIY